MNQLWKRIKEMIQSHLVIHLLSWCALGFDVSSLLFLVSEGLPTSATATPVWNLTAVHLTCLVHNLIVHIHFLRMFPENLKVVYTYFPIGKGAFSGIHLNTPTIYHHLPVGWISHFIESH